MRSSFLSLPAVCVAIVLLSAFSVITAFSSCSLFTIQTADQSASAGKEASLFVQGLSFAARAAQPSAEPAAFTSILLTGSRAGESSRSLASWNSYTAMLLSAVALETGSWSFTLTATAGNLTYSGSLSAAITSGENHVSFSLSLTAITYSGSGDLDIQLTAPESVSAVTAGLYRSDGLSQVLADEALTVTPGDGSVSARYTKKALAAGIYLVIFRLYGGDGLFLGDWREYAGITGGSTSTSSPVCDSVDDIYTISYELDGGTISGSFSGSYSRHSDDLSLPASSALARPNALFRYWYELDSSGNEVILSQIAAGSTGNRTIYAKWRYTALYVSESGSDVNSGSSLEKAKASLAAALAAFDASDYDCTLYVSGTASSGGALLDDSLAVKSLTIVGYGTASSGEDASNLSAWTTWPDAIDGAGSASCLTITADCTRPVSLQYLTLQNGRAEQGAGIQMLGDISLSLSYVAVTANTASSRGGGIHASSGTLSLTNCLLLENVISSGSNSAYGAGLSVDGASVLLDSSSISGNKMTGSYAGGTVAYSCGIYLSQGSVTLSGTTTVWGGSSEGFDRLLGNAAYVAEGAQLILQDQVSLDSIYLPRGAVVSLGGDLPADALSVATLEPAVHEEGLQVLSGTESRLSANAGKFSVVDDAEGASWAVASDGCLLSTTLYVAGSSASSDLGSPSDANAGSKASPLASLQAAVDFIAARRWSQTATVFISGSVTGSLSLTDSICASSLRLSGYFGNDGIFGASLSSESAEPAILATGVSSLELNNLTITASGGGLVLKDSGFASINSSTISGSSGSAVSAGGSCFVSLSSSTISDNTATAGGAIYLTDSAGATLYSCELSSNLAEQGGAIYSESRSANGGWLSLWDCSLSGNSASAQGGAVYLAEGASLSIYGGSIGGNSAGELAGAIYSGGSLSFFDSPCIASDNDVYLPSASSIFVGSDLTATSSVARLSPESYTEGVRLLWEEDPAKNGYIASSYRLFSVTPSAEAQWSVSEAGLLQEGEALERYAIRYELGGGSWADGYTPPLTYTIKDTIVLPDAAFALRSGYGFSGWYENEGLSGDKVTVIPAGSEGDRTFYAAWTAGAVPYTVRHWLQPLSAGDDLSAYEEDTAALQTLTGLSGELTAAEPKSYEGFTPLNLDQKVIAADGSTEVSIFYQRKTICYTFDPAGASWEDGDSAVKTLTGLYGASFSLPALTYPGYEGSWSPELPSTFGPEDASFTAEWTPITYTIDYQLNGGINAASNPESYTIESGEIVLSAPTFSGATFSGWYSDEDFTQAVTGIPAGSTGNRTFYARWTSASIQPQVSNPSGDIAVEKSTASDELTGESLLILTAEAGYSSYRWLIDDENASGVAFASLSTDGASLTLRLSGLVQGYVYQIVVTGEKDGIRCLSQLEVAK